MYNKLVVPLDGSDLAEVTLPHVVEIASGCHIPQIFLVSVTERVKGRTSVAWWGEVASAREFHMPPQSGGMALGSSHTGMLYSSDSTKLKDVPAELGRMARTALDYLSRKSAELSEKGLNAEIRVLVGTPAEEIVSFAEREKADLIVMASTSKPGFSRWAMGNVANKVAKASDVPVLLVKPQPGFRETKKKRRGAAN